MDDKHYLVETLGKHGTLGEVHRGGEGQGVDVDELDVFQRGLCGDEIGFCGFLRSG